MVPNSLILYNLTAVCPTPISPTNGQVIFTGTSIGDVATYSCNPTLELIGSTTATCSWISEDLAAFSHARPTCDCKLVS